MNLDFYYKSYSKSRFNRYLDVADGNIKLAYKLYIIQESLSGAIHSLLSSFEVIFRNQVNDYMVDNYSPTWLLDLSMPSSVLKSKKTGYSHEMLLEARNKLIAKNKLSNDDMVAILSFGYWTSILQRRQLLLLNDLPIQAFKFVPDSIDRLKLIDIVHNNVNFCRNLRNQIAHLEPVIFTKDSAKISFKQLDLAEKLIIELTNWLGIDTLIYDAHIETIHVLKQEIISIYNKSVLKH